MKQSQLLRRMLSVAGVGTAAVTLLGFASGDALAGISNTKHNLTASGTGANQQSTATEICVFCHTPHAADTAAPAPLWNKKLPDSTSYTTYASMGSSTLDASTVATGSVSLACLSCHDGTQAMDNIINAPGAGGYDSTGGGGTGLSWDWGSSPRADTDGKMGNTTDTLAMLGTDLRNDHPIGISYCAKTSLSSTCGDADFVAATQVGSTNNYYVEASSNSAKDKSDMILYTRSFGGTLLPSVECASCHDPHVESKATTEVAFLRKSQAGSGLCLACHTK